MDNYDRYKDNCYGKPVNYMWIFLPSQVPNQFLDILLLIYLFMMTTKWNSSDFMYRPQRDQWNIILKHI